MGKTAIEWTDHSISPIRARNKATGKVFHFCEKVSPGCAHCYAESLALRFGLFEYQQRNRDKVEFFLDEAKLQEVLRRKKPTKYFWEDCSDLFGDWVPLEWIDKCLAVMALTPQHTHQVLTKRPERMAEYFADDDPQMSTCVRRRILNSIDDEAMEQLGERVHGENLLLHDRLMQMEDEWPLTNVWLGTSVENQEMADERIPHLLRTPAAVRFLSAEPLLSRVDLGLRNWAHIGERRDDCRLDWVIVGGESGAGARVCNLADVRLIVEDCAAAGVPCFVKQLGSRPHEETTISAAELMFPNGVPAGAIVEGFSTTVRDNWLRDGKGGDPAEWPEDLRVRQMPVLSTEYAVPEEAS